MVIGSGMTRRPCALVTGGTGLLGTALLETAPPGWDVVATFHSRPPAEPWRGLFHQLDVRDAAAVRTLVAAVRPDVVIHTASVGSVEDAERRPEEVRAVNLGGTQAVGRACEEQGARLVFISSNAVFDGTRPPYAEGDPVLAVNRYGGIKIEAEAWIRERCRALAAIIRPILLYGWPLPGGRGNVVTRWLESLEERRPIEVDPRLWTMPLLAANAAAAVWAAAGHARTGIYHVAGADRLPLMEFARRVARVFHRDERLIQPASAAFVAQFAPRPLDTSFVTTKMVEELGVRPLGVTEGLALLQRARVASRVGG